MSSSEGDKVIRSKLAREMDSGVSLVNIGHWTAEPGERRWATN
jgi:hypothetical protein